MCDTTFAAPVTTAAASKEGAEDLDRFLVHRRGDDLEGRRGLPAAPDDRAKLHVEATHLIGKLR